MISPVAVSTTPSYLHILNMFENDLQESLVPHLSWSQDEAD